MGLTQVLMDTALNSDQAEYARLILSTAERLSSLINDILDLTKMESHKLELRSQPCDISMVVGEVAELMSFSIFQKGLEFVTYIQPPCEVLCDGNRLKQVRGELRALSLLTSTNRSVF